MFLHVNGTMTFIKTGRSRSRSRSRPTVAAEGVLRWGAKLLIKRQSYKSAKKGNVFQ